MKNSELIGTFLYMHGLENCFTNVRFAHKNDFMTSGNQFYRTFSLPHSSLHYSHCTVFKNNNNKKIAHLLCRLVYSLCSANTHTHQKIKVEMQWSENVIQVDKIVHRLLLLNHEING